MYLCVRSCNCLVSITAVNLSYEYYSNFQSPWQNPDLVNTIIVIRVFMSINIQCILLRGAEGGNKILQVG
jgi:putative effector of murein hydrolase